MFVLIRTAITYFFAIFLFRIGSKRFRLNSPLDFVVIVIIGAILGRTIYGGSSLFNTLFASLLIMILHEILARLSFISKRVGYIFKGCSRKLIDNGTIDWHRMRIETITEDDIIAICRKELKTDDLSQINTAYLERSGEITLIPKTKAKLS